MANSMIDSLLPTLAPSRAPDPRRGVEGRGSFAPVLDEARQADSQAHASQPVLRDDPERTDDDAPADAANSGVEASATESEVAFGAAGNGDSTADEHDVQATATATDDELVAEQVEDDEDSGDEAVVDVVEFSAAEPDVVAAAPQVSPVVVEAPAEVHEEQVVPATAANGAADDAATRPPSEHTSEQPRTADPTELEIGDVRVLPSREIGDAPPNLDSLKAAVEAAARAAQAVKDAQGADNFSKTAGKSIRSDADKETPSKAARGKATTPSPLPLEASSQRKPSDATADAADPLEGEHERSTKPAASVVMQQADAAATVVADVARPPKTTPSEAVDVSAPPANAATPVAAQPSNADAGATARSAAALARLTAERSIPTASGTGDEIDRTRFVGRVEGAIRTAQQRDGRVHVRLSPPELGALRIELTMQNGVLSARLEADTQAARNLLLDNLPALRERLAQQDVRIDRFDVDVRRDGGGSSGGEQQHNGAQDRQAQDPHWRQAQQRQGRAVAAAPIAAPSQRTSAQTNAALDVRV